jgi:hypothetical protein
MIERKDDRKRRYMKVVSDKGREIMHERKREKNEKRGSYIENEIEVEKPRIQERKRNR